MLVSMCAAYTISQATGLARWCCQAWVATSTHVVRGSARHSSWWWIQVSSRLIPPASSHGEQSLTISWHTTVRHSKICLVSAPHVPPQVCRFHLVVVARNWEVSGLNLTQSTAGKLEQVANLLCAQANSAFCP